MPDKMFRATVNNKIVDLDGGEYIDCVFKDCNMRYAGTAPYVMTGCTFDGCRFELVNAAANTIGYLNAMYNGGGEGGKDLILDIIYFVTEGELGKKLIYTSQAESHAEKSESRVASNE